PDWYGIRGASGCTYARPTSRSPVVRSTISYDAMPPSAMTAATADSITQTYSVLSTEPSRTFAYENRGWTAIARFAGSVQGVVVQISKDSFGWSASGNFT